MQRRDAFLGVLALIVLWQLLAWAVRQPILPPPGQVLLLFLQQLPGE
ncbi:MAG: ABC transporter permease, partial [Chloroflexota bacterium]